MCCHHVRFHGVPVSLLHTIAPLFFHAIAVLCKTTCHDAHVAADLTARNRSPRFALRRTSEIIFFIPIIHDSTANLTTTSYNRRSTRLNESSSTSLSQNLNREAMESSSISSEQKSQSAWRGSGKGPSETIAHEVLPHVVPTSTFFSKLYAKERQRMNPNSSGVTSLEGGFCNRNVFDDKFGTRRCHNIQRLRAIESILSRDLAFVDGVDMKQMSTIVTHEKMRQKMIWEDDRVHSNVQTPHLIGKIISQFLYGDRFCKTIEMQQLEDLLNGHEMLDTLPQSCDNDSKKAWEQVMFDYLLCGQNTKLGSGPVCIIGRPSTEVYQKQLQQESARFEENCKVYDIPREMERVEHAFGYLASEKLFVPAETLYEMPLHSPVGAKYFPIISIRSTPNNDSEVEGSGHTSISLLTGSPPNVEDENLSDTSVQFYTHLHRTFYEFRAISRRQSLMNRRVVRVECNPELILQHNLLIVWSLRREET